jgi:hypothetical protein
MAEEKVVQKQEEQKNESVEKPALTEIEQRAHAEGWVPKDEWDGDPDQWRPAKEFLDRGELFKKIEDQNRSLKEMRRTLEEFGKHHAKVREVEFKRALEILKGQKKEALTEGDVDKVVDIDEKIDAVKDAQRASAQQTVRLPDVPEGNPIFDSWVERNSWYKNSSAMRAYADRLGNELGAHGGISPTDLLAKVEQEVKKEFAHKFQNPNREKPGAVEGSSGKGTSSGKSYQLTEEERRIGERWVRTIPGFTMEKYTAELKKVKERGV